jgi:hypothetical protein
MSRNRYHQAARALDDEEFIRLGQRKVAGVDFNPIKLGGAMRRQRER